MRISTSVLMCESSWVTVLSWPMQHKPGTVAQRCLSWHASSNHNRTRHVCSYIPCSYIPLLKCMHVQCTEFEQHSCNFPVQQLAQTASGLLGVLTVLLMKTCNIGLHCARLLQCSVLHV